MSPHYRRLILLLVLGVLLVLAVVALVDSDGRPAQAQTAPVRVVVFGDSIPEGCCRPSPSTQPHVGLELAAELGWTYVDVKDDGSGGTGYGVPGPVAGRQSYQDRIGRVLTSAGTVQAVVIMGGGNDPSSDLVDFRADVRRTYERGLAVQPTARFYVVTPYSPNAAGYGAKATVVREEATRMGWPVVDLNRRGWMDGAREASRLHSDLFHPDDEGHRYLGEQLARELAWMGAPRR